MKNILIMGIGRAGKTTLSNMIKEKYSEYNLVHSDCIKWAIIRSKGMEEYYSINIKEQKEFEHSEEFQRVLLEFFASSIRNDLNKNGYILESGQLQPELVKEFVNFENTEVICLGLGELNRDDIIRMCRDNDKVEDWTYDVSDEELEAHANKWAEMNEKLKRDCPKCGIKYIDTSKKRIETLNNILNNIVV